MIKSLLYKLFEREGVTNLQDYFDSLLSKVSSTRTPEKEVLSQIESEELNPREYELNELFKSQRVRDFICTETYDSIWGVYQTMRGYGFILQASALTGIKENTDALLKGLFSLNLPDNCCIQINLYGSGQTLGLMESWKNNKINDPLIQNLCDERIKFLSKGSKQPLFDNTKISIKDFRLYFTFVFEGAFDSEEKQEYIKNTRESIRALLKSVDIETVVVGADEYLSLVREIWGCRQQDRENLSYDSRISIRDQIVEPDNKIWIDPDGLVINDTSVKTLMVRKYPDSPSLVQMAGLIGDKMSEVMQLSYPFLFTQNIKLLNREKTNAKLLKDSDQYIRQSKNGLGRVIPIIDKKAHEYQLLKDLFAQGESVVEMGHFLHIFSPLGKSHAATEEAIAIFKNRGWQLVNAAYIQAACLLVSTPLMHDPLSAKEQKKLGMLKWMTEVNASNTMPVVADWTGTTNNAIQLISKRGQLQQFDIFDNKKGNYNVAVVAASGSGKSYFLNELLFSYYAKGAKCWVIDVGRSYKFICEALGGQFIEFSESSKICLNPFSGIIDEKDEYLLKGDIGLINSDEDSTVLLADIKDRLEMLKKIVLVAAGRNLDDKTEDSFVEQAILAALQKNKSKTTFTSVYEELLAMGDDKRTKDIAQSIKSYTKFGLHGQYFEGINNINLSNRLTVLELEELKAKGQLANVVLLIMMLQITQEMYLSDRSIPKKCIIDEAWDLIGSGNSGEFIKTGYRRARKYNGSFLTATQSIDDYFLNAATKACWANADWKFLLRQGAMPKEIELDEATQMLLKSLKTEAGKYSEILIRLGEQNCDIARLIVDPFSNYLYSSEPNDVQMINNLKNNESLDTSGAIYYLLNIVEHMHKNFNITPQSVTKVLVPQIANHGYERVKQQYGF